MISAVSFRGAEETSSSFSDLVSKPQAYTGDTQPSAASGVNGDSYEGKKGSKGKKVLGVLAAVAAIAGVLALGSKTGISNKIPKVGEYLDKAGKTVIEKSKAVFNSIKDKAQGLGKAETVAGADAAETAAGATAEVKEAAAGAAEKVKEAAADAADNIVNNIG